MGMYDRVKAPAIVCDCGAEVDGWQSKDGECLLDLIEVDDLKASMQDLELAARAPELMTELTDLQRFVRDQAQKISKHKKAIRQYFPARTRCSELNAIIEDFIEAAEAIEARVVGEL